MAQVIERGRARTPAQRTAVEQDAVVAGHHGTALRILGALALLVVGAVHLEQYFRVHFDVVPVIGPMFLLNFAGATAIAAGLLLPLRRLDVLLGLGGIGLAVASIVFLEISEHRPLFGFEDYGYRPAIVIALVAEAATAILLGAYLSVRGRS